MQPAKRLPTVARQGHARRVDSASDEGLQERLAAALATPRWQGSYSLAVDGGYLEASGRDWVVIGDSLARAADAGDEYARALLARVLLHEHEVGTPVDPRHPDWPAST